MKKLLTLFILVVMLALVSSPVLAQKTWNDVVNDMENELNKATEAYRQGDVAAKEFVNEGYKYLG